MAIVKAKKAGRVAVKVAHSIIDFTVLTIILLLVAFAAYAIWDSDQVYQAADAAQYAVYKPSTEDSISFAELQTINPEVFSWLTVYGTKIDYPITQGTDNMKYVNTNAKGAYSLSGSIFLDYMNDKDFQDFNSILYGHHMEKQAMFGELGLFSGKRFFDSRVYGNLYYGGKDHGLEFFAFIKTDAYDAGIFSPNVQGREAQQKYLNNLLAKAMYTRDIGVTTDDHILLLTTCSTEATNGRDLLVARITNECYGDAFKTEEKSDATEQASVDQQFGFWGRIPLWLRMVLPVLLFIVLIYIFRRNRVKR
ncbi:class B sortase [Desulforamulus aeronauticus]|uniref:Sortase B n=1 Tax=Desulforamulus aeronauticus DSM 10349 TaxID=1121421 RepID=A0A1M6VSZ0_9FIRM|nr:class B sortase [Desulforamulus aeronauticus]SHK84617.1 sortase B [Desulforamulus aeronauticus DSM 10349]